MAEMNAVTPTERRRNPSASCSVADTVPGLTEDDHPLEAKPSPARCVVLQLRIVQSLRDEWHDDRGDAADGREEAEGDGRSVGVLACYVAGGT